MALFPESRGAFQDCKPDNLTFRGDLDYCPGQSSSGGFKLEPPNKVCHFILAPRIPPNNVCHLFLPPRIPPNLFQGDSGGRLPSYPNRLVPLRSSSNKNHPLGTSTLSSLALPCLWASLAWTWQWGYKII